MSKSVRIVRVLRAVGIVLLLLAAIAALLLWWKDPKRQVIGPFVAEAGPAGEP